MNGRHIGGVGVSLVALFVALAASWLLKPLPATESSIEFRPVGFDALREWEEDDPGPALEAFVRSCGRLGGLPPQQPVGSKTVGIKPSDLRGACRRAREVESGDAAEVRRYFETEFEPVAVTGVGKAEGLFTGYYEPLFEGSRQRIGRFNVPIHGRPEDLVTANLGDFRPEWNGIQLVGRLNDGRLRPFETRAAIERGELADRAKPIIWLRDEVDAFFLHIQGTGRINLNDGTQTRVGFTASNGHPYTAIGRELVERGALPEDGVSMQSIRQWLKSNPRMARNVMSSNARYIFFREIAGEGPIGAGQVVLTPGRSLAVDTTLLPLHAPVWLETSMPSTADNPDGAPLRRLLIAQDTGSAIRGAVRGDVFWGSGPAAEEVAGKMSETGRYYLLLPKGTRERIVAGMQKAN